MRKKIVLLVSFLYISFLITDFYSVYSEEVPVKAYQGVENTSVIINNIDFTDVKNSRTWSKEAIAETSTLGIIKGYGNKVFGPTRNVTKEEAIAVIYRAIGRESDGEKAGEEIDNKRLQDEKKTYAPSMWSDGYLQLAAEDGLITPQDLDDALAADKSGFTSESFIRDAPAKRQEFALWMAKALKLEPVYGQQEIFNSFRDWQVAKPYNIPYIEAVLANNIMNGEGNGFFRPDGNITREQVAQIVKNASNFLYPFLGYEKNMGIVEGIKSSTDFSEGRSITGKTFNIRGTDGKLYTIFTKTDVTTDGSKNELSGASLKSGELDFPVFKNGWIRKGDLIKGDRIEYIASTDSEVKYVKVLSNITDTKYIVAKINSVDTKSNTLNISKIFDLNYPDVNIEDKNFSFNEKGEDVDVKFTYSNNVEVFKDKIKSSINDIENGSDAIIELKGTIIVAIRKIDLGLKEGGVVSGIVEDNNPDLGYIALYNEKGKGLNGSVSERLPNLKTYSYSDLRNIEVLKNYKPALIEDIEAGDTIYIKLDDKGMVQAVSAVDNYVTKYGKVISKRPLTMAVKYDDGEQQILEIPAEIRVFLDKRPSDYNSLKDGDRVKLLLNITNNFTRVKQITIEGEEHFVTNIYKGVVAEIDKTSNKVILQNLEILQNGKWSRTDQKGFSTIGLGSLKNIYFDSKEVDVDMVKNNLRYSQAYMAVEKDYGGEERIVFMSFKNTADYETPVLDDNIAKASLGTEGDVLLENEFKEMYYDNGTIIVKNKRLVTGNSISPDDRAYVVANRDNKQDSYNVKILEIDERPNPEFIKIYRARISDINENKDFTVKSFSVLEGLEWNFYNTPKTFMISYDTRIEDEKGIIGQREFTDYGEENFKDRTVYILSKGTDAEVVNTLPYGNINVKGEIFELNLGEGEDDSSFKLTNTSIYDPSSYMWMSTGEMSINLLKNSIVLKNNSISKVEDLRNGDKIRLIKSDPAPEGYIIFVE